MIRGIKLLQWEWHPILSLVSSIEAWGVLGMTETRAQRQAIISVFRLHRLPQATGQVRPKQPESQPLQLFCDRDIRTHISGAK